MRERMQVATDEADHELVVAGVDAMAREPDVVRQLLLPVRDTERSMLAQDVALLDRLLFGERSLPPQRIPDVPAIGLVGDVLDRAAEERPLELGLVARRIRPPEHPEVFAELDAREQRLGEQWPHFADEARGILAPRQEPEAPWVHRVGVDDAWDLP